LLSVVTFILFTSCEKEEEPNSLAIDLQNGYWESDLNSAIIVLKFNTSTVSSNWIEGIPPCIVDTSTQDYTLKGNVLKLGDTLLTAEIQGNILTTEDDGFITTFERKSTLDYPDC
jgi:hypothetical protein